MFIGDMFEFEDVDGTIYQDILIYYKKPHMVILYRNWDYYKDCLIIYKSKVSHYKKFIKKEDE